MTWPQWVLIAWLVLSALVMVARVGKPREPIEPEAAVVNLVVTALVVWLVVLA